MAAPRPGRQHADSEQKNGDGGQDDLQSDGTSRDRLEEHVLGIGHRSGKNTPTSGATVSVQNDATCHL